MKRSVGVVFLQPDCLTVGDFIDAENAVGGHYPMNISAHLMLKRFRPLTTSPLTLGTIRQLAPRSFHQLLTAQHAFELLRDGWSSLALINDSAKFVEALVGQCSTSNYHLGDTALHN